MALENQPVMIDGEEVYIAVSIGASEYKRNGMVSQEIIHATDTALYQAKANGRNCIFVYDL
jgi:diguanylate cyclase